MEKEKKNERAKWIEEEHLEFLDDLRESGVTNMFGARSYIIEKFETLTQEQASSLLTYWMKTFPRKGN